MASRSSSVTKERHGATANDLAANDCAVQVLRRFRSIFNAVKTHFQQVEKKVGVGGAQVWALSIIGQHPGIGVSGLARAMDVHQSTASNLVKTLVERGMVDAVKQGPDRRAVQLTLRPEGGAVLRRAPKPFTGLLPDALARLDARTLKRLDSDLAALMEALGIDERDAGALIANNL